MRLSNEVDHFVGFNRRTCTHVCVTTRTDGGRARANSKACSRGELAAFMQIRACARGKFLIQFGFAYTLVT